MASRLTNINHLGPNGTIEALTYQYDAAGNRTSLTRSNAAASLLPAAVASATYDAANEQTAFAGATLTYDTNGNLTNDGTNTYVWDARNRLVSISGGATASFNYDALGRRVHKTRSTPTPALSTGFLYDGNDIAAEVGGGAVGANYIRSLNIDEPFIRQAGTGNEFYHADALGSSLALSNAQGASAATYTYEPFGKTTVSGTSSNVFQYTGRENDGTGLYYYRTRHYSPRPQRFVSEDPIGLLGGLNYYSYVINNPLSFRDPSGLFGIREPLGVGGAAALGCSAGALGGIGGRKPLQGAIVGGLIGCNYSPLMIGLQLLPAYKGLSIGLGAYIGAVSGAATAAAQGGTLTDIAIGTAGGLIGGAISGAISNPFLSTGAGQIGSAILTNAAGLLGK